MIVLCVLLFVVLDNKSFESTLGTLEKQSIKNSLGFQYTVQAIPPSDVPQRAKVPNGSETLAVLSSG